MPQPKDVHAPASQTGLTITRHLPVPLTDKRKVELLDELSAHVNEHNRLEKHKKELVDNITKAMRHRKGEIDKISQTVAQGMEIKPIACQKEIDYLNGRIIVTRIDTSEILEDRELSEEDMK